MKKVQTNRGQDLVVPEAGERKGGRKKGTTNVMTTVVKEAMMLAIQASEHSDGKGLVGYLTKVADERMDLMVGLIGRLLPMQVNSKSEPPEKIIYKTTEEVRAALIAKGLSPRRVDLIIGKDLDVIEGSFMRKDNDAS
jgi:hypothetical protein